jgi:hypothetical protein
MVTHSAESLQVYETLSVESRLDHEKKICIETQYIALE